MQKLRTTTPEYALKDCSPAIESSDKQREPYCGHRQTQKIDKHNTKNSKLTQRFGARLY